MEWVLILSKGSSREDQDPLHGDLRNRLFSGYDKNILPIQKLNTSVEIAVGVALIHIDSLEEGVLTASAWLRMVWNDYRLQWDQKKFGNVSVLRVYPNDLWLPDIELYNTKEYRQFSLAAQCLATRGHWGKPSKLRHFQTFSGPIEAGSRS